MKPSETLVAYIEAEIIPRYAAFDRAHDERHVRTVIERSLALAGQLGADADMAYTVAAYHDTGLTAGRERHHTVSGEILAADTALRRWFDEEQIAAMRQAVEDHRASAGAPPRNLYGRIVAEADRLIEPMTSSAARSSTGWPTTRNSTARAITPAAWSTCSTNTATEATCACGSPSRRMPDGWRSCAPCSAARSRSAKHSNASSTRRPPADRAHPSPPCRTPHGPGRHPSP